MGPSNLGQVLRAKLVHLSQKRRSKSSATATPGRNGLTIGEAQNSLCPFAFPYNPKRGSNMGQQNEPCQPPCDLYWHMCIPDPHCSQLARALESLLHETTSAAEHLPPMQRSVWHSHSLGGAQRTCADTLHTDAQICSRSSRSAPCHRKYTRDGCVSTRGNPQTCLASFRRPFNSRRTQMDDKMPPMPITSLGPS